MILNANREFNVLSLFDGMSCTQLALQKLGITPTNYFSCEIDKHAIKVTQHNFPNTIQLGDITKVDFHRLPKIHLLVGGSPCQGFSFAGLGLNFNDPRSKLFFNYFTALKQVNPDYFLLENVKMKKQHQDVISKYLEVEPIVINSALVSAQNRHRLYWSNIPGIQQPEDRKIILKDIIQWEDKSINSNTWHEWFDKNKNFQLAKKYSNIMNDTTKAITLTARQVSSWTGNILQINPDRSCGGKQPHMQDRVYDVAGKSPALTSFANRLNVAYPANLTERRTEEAKQIRRESMKQGIDFSPRGMKELVPRTDGKVNTLVTGLDVNHLLCFDDLKFRFITTVEAERLQNVPDGYTSCVSNTQAYKMLGNGFTVDVIAHILSYIPEIKKPILRQA